MYTTSHYYLKLSNYLCALISREYFRIKYQHHQN